MKHKETKFLIIVRILVAPEVFTKGVIGAAEGGVVILKCDAKAYPTAMVEWMHDGSKTKQCIIFQDLIFGFLKEISSPPTVLGRSTRLYVQSSKQRRFF